jgi:hypothetical protein
MKGQVVRAAMAMLLVFGVSVAGAATQKVTKIKKPATSQVQTYTGTVKVTKDKAGQITVVKLNAGKLPSRKYTVALDKEGKELGEKMAAQRVQVKGVLEKQAGKNVLVVKEYSLSPSTATTKTPATKTPLTKTLTKRTTTKAEKGK